MTEHGYRLYEYIVQGTGSELIRFFAMAAVFAIPMYVAILQGRKAEWERQKYVAEVVKDNTGVMARLIALLEADREERKEGLNRMHGRIDAQVEVVGQMAVAVDKSNERLDAVLGNQNEAAKKIDKILHIVDSIPNNSIFSSQNK